MLRLLARRTYSRWGDPEKLQITILSRKYHMEYVLPLHRYRSTPIEYVSAKQDSFTAIRGNVKKELRSTLLQ